MRVPTVGQSQSVSFNVTPLIDIVFLLIIFFLVASHVARSDAVEPVDLPLASELDQGDENPNRIVVTVLANHTMHLAGQQITLNELENAILGGTQNTDKPLDVRIRADRTATYAEIEPILLICAEFGVTQIGFHALPKRGR
jgi:biopolymer transport protein ExbD